jgi:hypothetical protein
MSAAAIIRLATRPTGISREEFMTATHRESASPKMVLAGYAKRWGYALRIA